MWRRVAFGTLLVAVSSAAPHPSFGPALPAGRSAAHEKRRGALKRIRGGTSVPSTSTSENDPPLENRPAGSPDELAQVSSAEPATSTGDGSLGGDGDGPGPGAPTPVLSPVPPAEWPLPASVQEVGVAPEATKPSLGMSKSMRDLTKYGSFALLVLQNSALT